MIDKIDQNMVTEEFSEAMDHRFTGYAFMSLEDRALPDARDGLKPSQRRVLVAMNDLKLWPGGATEKSAKICGDTSGNYHPHGEAVVYPTMYRLVQPWIMRYPLILGQGNFGNPDGDSPAAMRYTEAKLSRYGEAMLSGCSQDTVPYKSNYNEKRLEPTILPASVPNLLINGVEGIAVGWATRIPPHNLREVVDVVKAYIADPTITPERVIELMPGPDFPTGGKLLGQGGVLEYYKTGRGQVKLEGDYDIERVKDKAQIVVTALPHQASPATFCTEVEKLVDSGKHKLDGIQDLKNLSSKKTGTRVVIELAKGVNPQLILKFLLKHTCLSKTVSINATVLIDGKVASEAPILKLVAAFVEHRQVVLTSKFTAELEAVNKRLHILEGLLGIVDKIDAVIALIRASESGEEAEQQLIAKKFVKTMEQAKAVLAITLRQLTKLESDKLIAEQTELAKRANWLRKVLGSEKELKKVIVQEQEEIAKKFGDDRRTVIANDAVEILDEDLVRDEKLIVTLSGEGYVRSAPSEDYRLQRRGGTGSMGVSKSAAAENVVEFFEMHSKDTLLFFTNKGSVYQKRAFEVPQGAKTGKGGHVSNLLNLTHDEVVTNMLSLKSLNQKGFLVIVTRNGYIKKTSISEYDTNRKNAGIKAVKLVDDDEVAFVFLSTGNKDIFLVTQDGKCVRYNEKIVPELGRGTRGSIAMKLEDGDKIVQVMPVDPKDVPDILVVTVGGLGKKSSSEEYKSLSSRSVKGYAVMSKKAIDKSGKLAGACCIDKEDNVLVMTKNGKCIRMDSTTLRSTGRTTMGVNVVKLDDMDSVVKVAKLSPELDEV